MNKRGQVTIFIVIGLILVGAVVLFFVVRSGFVLNLFKEKEINSASFLDLCIEEKLREGVQMISMRGGHITNPLNRTFQFIGEKSNDISYLCYNQNYYLPCINQEPMLIQHLKKEIKEYINQDVEECFNKLSASLEKQNYEVEKIYRDFDVEFAPGKIILNIDAELSLKKNEEVSIEKGFKIIKLSNFYDTAVVVQEIISQEAQYCNFEYTGYMLLYPKFKIEKFTTGDSTEIYRVEHKNSKEKFQFAVRSCVIPPGV
ncbi:MAG: hypothetical protein ABH804_00395 [archaeon]